MSEFSNKLQALREAKGWSKTYVSKKLGLKPQRYSNYEYGTREPDFQILTDIAKLYNVSIDYLLGNKERKEQTVQQALESVMSFDGKPMTDNDREIIEGLIRAYMSNKK